MKHKTRNRVFLFVRSTFESVPLCAHLRPRSATDNGHDRRGGSVPDIYLEASVPAQRRSPEKSERGDPSFSSFERYFDIRGGSSGETRGQGLSASTSGANAPAAQVKEPQARHSHSRGPSASSSVVASTPFLFCNYFRVSGCQYARSSSSEPNPELPKPVNRRNSQKRRTNPEAIKVPAPLDDSGRLRTRCQPTPRFRSPVVLRPVYCSDRPLNFLSFSASPPQARNKLMEEHIESVGRIARES